MRVCGQPGCPELTTSARCPAHTVRIPDGRPSASKRGYDTQHRAERKAWLAAHPVCQCPGYTGCAHQPGTCGQPSTVLDHADGRGPHGPRGHDPANWLALDASCHARKTRAGL